MKLNISFVPFSGADKEFKIMAYGDRDALIEFIRGVQEHNFCTNVYLSDDKKDSN